MALNGFKPVAGGITLNTAGFALPGDNMGFCRSILERDAKGPQMRLESLTYTEPAAGEERNRDDPRSTVVNLLIQLNACYDRSNAFLRGQAALDRQLTLQLRQALIRADGAVRARTEQIEQAVRDGLYRDGEFRRAVEKLERELKKKLR